MGQPAANAGGTVVVAARFDAPIFQRIRLTHSLADASLTPSCAAMALLGTPATRCRSTASSFLVNEPPRWATSRWCSSSHLRMKGGIGYSPSTMSWMMSPTSSASSLGTWHPSQLVNDRFECS